MSVDNEFLLSDRIAKIRAINKQYNLLDNAYISFSGGERLYYPSLLNG